MTLKLRRILYRLIIALGAVSGFAAYVAHVLVVGRSGALVTGAVVGFLVYFVGLAILVGIREWQGKRHPG